MFCVCCIVMIRRRFLTCPASLPAYRVPSPLHASSHCMLCIICLRGCTQKKYKKKKPKVCIEILRWYFNKNVQREMMRQLKHDVILISLHKPGTCVVFYTLSSPLPLPCLALYKLFHAILINFAIHRCRVGSTAFPPAFFS